MSVRGLVVDVDRVRRCRCAVQFLSMSLQFFEASIGCVPQERLSATQVARADGVHVSV